MKIDGLLGTLWVLPMELDYLMALPRQYPGNILEIGTYDGCLAALWARAFPDRQVHSIDGFCCGWGTSPGNKSNYETNTKGLGNAKLLEGRSTDELAKLRDERYEIIFVDGDHSKDMVHSDASQAWRNLLPGGIMVFHDYDAHVETREGVYEFWRRVCPALPLHHTPGQMAAIVKGA